MRWLPIAAAVPVIALAWPDEANAAAPDDGFHKAGFVTASPGLFYIPIGDDDTRDNFDIGYQWGIGGGYMFKRNRFALTAGASLEHLIANFDDCDNDDCKGGMLRVVPELRIGGASKRIFVYGRANAGLAYSYAEVDLVIGNVEDDDLGVNFGLGGGVQGIVWSNLAVGGELNADLAFFDDDNGIDDVHTLSVKAFVAWYF